MKYLILGAGPAGLTFANRLYQRGERDFLVLEKENEAGGLCRSVEIDGSPLDIGGGHFVDVKNKRVLEFLFEVMPEEEWNLFERNSKIDLYGAMISSPIEANIWQLPLQEQVEYLKSIAVAGCNINTIMPEKFVDWIYWKLGRKIAEDYMLPYNRKMFGDNLNDLGTYWLEKLPDVSFKETLMSCLEKKAFGKQPGHARFYYPKKYGSGEVWNRLAKRIEENVIYGLDIKKMDLQKHTVNDEYTATYIINTIPWQEFDEIKGLEDELKDKIKRLKYTSVSIEYYDDNLDDDAHWIYYPDESLEYHRILLRNNFYENAKGYWTESNADRVKEKTSKYTFLNQYAYPLNTIGKREIVSGLLDYLKKYQVYGLGRWGEWEHYNSDVVVDKAISLADKLKDDEIQK